VLIGKSLDLGLDGLAFGIGRIGRKLVSQDPESSIDPITAASL